MDLRGARRLSGQVSGLDSLVELSVWILNDRRESLQLPITMQPSGSFLLPLPRSSVALLGFALAERPDALAHRAHAVGEGRNTMAAPAGTLLLSHLQRDGLALDVGSGLPKSGPTQVSPSGGLRWQYALIGGRAWASVVRAPVRVRAVVDPDTAALVRNGVLAVRINDAIVIPVQVSLVARRLPTVSQHFLLLAPATLDALLAAYAPELLRVSDVWLSKPLPAALAHSGQLIGLTVTDRAAVQALDAASAASLWSTRTLELLVLVVLLLLFAFVFSTVREIAASSDAAGWAAQGLSYSAMHASLRRIVLLFTTLAALLALALLPLLFPLLLTRSNVDLAGNPAVPPLAPVSDLPRQMLVVAASALLAWTASTLAIGSQQRQRKRRGDAL